METDLWLISDTNINFRWITDLNCKRPGITGREYFYNLVVKDFLSKTAIFKAGLDSGKQKSPLYKKVP